MRSRVAMATPERKLGGEFVVAGGDTAEIFETAEGVLDQVAAAVAVLIVADSAFPVAPPRNDRTAPASRSERRSRSAS